MIRLFIQKNSGKLHSESEGLFFTYNRKLMSGNVKVGDFVAKEFKDTEKDGWVHIQYGKQERFGWLFDFDLKHIYAIYFEEWKTDATQDFAIIESNKRSILGKANLGKA